MLAMLLNGDFCYVLRSICHLWCIELGVSHSSAAVFTSCVVVSRVPDDMQYAAPSKYLVQVAVMDIRSRTHASHTGSTS